MREAGLRKAIGRKKGLRRVFPPVVFFFVFVFVLFASKQFIKTDLAAVLGGTSQHLRLVLCYLDMCRGSGGKEADLGGRVSFFMVHPSIRAEVPASRDRHLSVDSQV